MALLNTYTSANQVVTQGLVVKYSVEQDSLRVLEWHPSPDNPDVDVYSEYDMVFYRCTRYATKRYSYIGMTAAAAAACAAAKIAQYTRAYSHIVTREVTDSQTGETTQTVEDATSTLCSSDIAPVHVEGDSWSVEIQVNETDEHVSLTSPSNVAALFATENARNYD